MAPAARRLGDADRNRGRRQYRLRLARVRLRAGQPGDPAGERRVEQRGAAARDCGFAARRPDRHRDGARDVHDGQNRPGSGRRHRGGRRLLARPAGCGRVAGSQRPAHVGEPDHRLCAGYRGGPGRRGRAAAVRDDLPHGVGPLQPSRDRTAPGRRLAAREPDRGAGGGDHHHRGQVRAAGRYPAERGAGATDDHWYRPAGEPGFHLLEPGSGGGQDRADAGRVASAAVLDRSGLHRRRSSPGRMPSPRRSSCCTSA